MEQEKVSLEESIRSAWREAEDIAYKKFINGALTFNSITSAYLLGRYSTSGDETDLVALTCGLIATGLSAAAKLYQAYQNSKTLR